MNWRNLRDLSDPRIIGHVKASHQRLLQGILLGTLVVLAIGTLFLPLPEMWKELQERIARPGHLGALWYSGIFAACNVLLLPGGVFSFAAGALFGVWRGFLIVFLGNSIGAALAFVIGRTFGRPLIQRLLSAHGGLLDPRDFRDNSWKMVLFSQLHPLFPTSLLVYVYSLTEISFWPCMGLIAAGRAPGLWLYSFMGAMGWQGLASGAHFQIFSWILAVILIFAVLHLGRSMLEKVSGRRQERYSADSSREESLVEYADV